MKEKKSEKPVLTTLREMKIGECATYPIGRTSYIRSACVNYGLEWGKKFKTSINRAERTITATRIA